MGPRKEDDEGRQKEVPAQRTGNGARVGLRALQGETLRSFVMPGMTGHPCPFPDGESGFAPPETPLFRSLPKGIELQACKLRIDAACRHELGVCPLLNNVPLIHHENAVGLQDRR